MTLIAIPFLHRFFGATQRNPEPRYIAAWDAFELDIPELPRSHFDIGSSLEDGRGTMFADGSHWAFFDGRKLGGTNGKNGTAGFPQAELRNLMTIVGRSMFFDEGPLRLNQADVISRTPPSQLITVSQRDRIIERVTAYALANFADVGGHIAVRVHEPSVILRAYDRPNSKSMCYLTLESSFLTPWQSVCRCYGIHFSLARTAEVLEIAQAEEAEMSDADELYMKVRLDKLRLHVASAEEMSERSILSLADWIVSTRMQKLAETNPALATISEISAKQLDSMSQQSFVDALDVMKAFRSRLYPSEKLMLRLAEDQWNERLVNVFDLLPAKSFGPRA
ncbi:hypothetical protein HFO56_24160 [Rhizobium laguerreae]|uniref:hypothetical protein n=1 Tax=Rhizobium laguerreae TaxID=1076926 RepID=UPI001C91F520|nr:hypothetical protein [Rhizobium laguerreae]MBY3155424.1 hypothetical protein [Rhizobium laguerreae]